MDIRRATPEDFEELLPVFIGLRRYSQSYHPPEQGLFQAAIASTDEHLRDVLSRNENEITLLAIDTDNCIAGYLIATMHEPYVRSSAGERRRGYINELFVSNQYRSTGAGSGLMKAIEEWFSEQGAEQIDVDAYSWNSDAIRFYERKGYEVSNVTLSRFPLQE